MERLSDKELTSAIFFEPIDSDLELTDGFVALFVLKQAIALGFLGRFAFGENLRSLVEKLAFPLGDLVRMQLMLLGQFVQGKPFADGIKEYPGFELRRKFAACLFH
ncbi:MAG: hypothetical protein HGB15_04400 [Chlorobaculum sp.]|nr:hypothetical protein [Chlorobaculum sp.]